MIFYTRDKKKVKRKRPNEREKKFIIIESRLTCSYIYIYILYCIIYVMVTDIISMKQIIR